MKKHYLFKKIIIKPGKIQSKIKKLAKTVNNYYSKQENLKENTVTLLGVLNGCIPFMGGLIKHLDFNCVTEYVKVSSYLGGTKSTGNVDIKFIKELDLKHKHVLIIEDIIDTGLTMSKMKKFLIEKGAADVKVISLFDKPEGRKIDFKTDWYGFSVPNEFLVGFGLDYEDRFRNLPYVASVKVDKLKTWKW